MYNINIIQLVILRYPHNLQNATLYSNVKVLSIEMNSVAL